MIQVPLAVALIATLVASTAAIAQDFPTLAKPVNDFANLIDAGSAAELDRRIRALEAKTTDAVVVVTVTSIAPSDSIEDYAVRLFERAGIGQRDRDNGLLVLVARDERQVRIEVGYELEAFVTDGFAGDVIRQQFLPAFKKGAYGEGLLAGVTRVIHRIADGRGVSIDDVPAARETEKPTVLDALVPLILFFLFIVFAASRGHRGRRFRGPRFPWGGFGGPFGGWGGGTGGFGGFGGFGGGGSGGGFGGFGGGMSGGGGASGRW